MSRSAHICGEVGILADENAQRLCSIFSEAATNCLVTLKELSQKHGTSRFNNLYAAGLLVVPSWTSDVVREEVTRIEAQYPEARTIFLYVYILLVGEVGDDVTAAHADPPTMEEVYHAFLRRVCVSPDVMLGMPFFHEPLAHRRVVFLDCFRNALHDILRRRTRGRPARAPLKEAQTDLEDKSCARSEVSKKSSIRSSGFRLAVEEAAEHAPLVTPNRVRLSVAALECASSGASAVGPNVSLGSHPASAAAHSVAHSATRSVVPVVPVATPVVAAPVVVLPSQAIQSVASPTEAAETPMPDDLTIKNVSVSASPWFFDDAEV
jgi:hypothetical protein